MTRIMKAAVCVEANKPLEIQNLPIPTPTGRQLLVRVKAATLCHSDLTTVSGGFGPLVPFPIVVGHEAVSVVESLGPEAASYGIKVGDIIGAGLWQDSCLSCMDCKTAGSHFCTKMNMQGVTVSGYFAEYALVDAATAVVVGQAGDEGKTSVTDLAPVFCAGITVWDALERADLKIGETIAIIGLGGLGAMAAQYAQKLGARVIALDVRDEQLVAAKNEGTVDEFINTTGLELPQLQQRVAEINGGRLIDKAIVTSGASPAYATSLGVVGAEGLIIAVGLATEPVPVDMMLMATRCTKLIGAKVPGQPGTQRCLDFTIRKGIRPKINSRKFALEDVNEMLDLMRDRKVDEGRMMIQFF